MVISSSINQSTPVSRQNPNESSSKPSAIKSFFLRMLAKFKIVKSMPVPRATPQSPMNASVSEARMSGIEQIPRSRTLPRRTQSMPVLRTAEQALAVQQKSLGQYDNSLKTLQRTLTLVRAHSAKEVSTPLKDLRVKNLSLKAQSIAFARKSESQHLVSSIQKLPSGLLTPSQQRSFKVELQALTQQHLALQREFAAINS